MCPKVEYHEMHMQSFFKNVIRKVYDIRERITFDVFMAHSFKLWSSELRYCVARLFIPKVSGENTTPLVSPQYEGHMCVRKFNLYILHVCRTTQCSNPEGRSEKHVINILVEK
jgi:hypothetical protein